MQMLPYSFSRLEDAADFETRKVLCGGQLLTVLFLDGLTSGGDIAEQVVRPLAQMTDEAREEVLYTRALQGGVWCASVKEPESTQQAAELLVNVSEKREGARLRGEDRGKAQPVAAGDGKHGQGREGCVYRDAAHEHEPGAAASADAGAAADGNGHRKKDADQGHGLLDRSPDGPGAAAQDAGETFFHRH